QQQHGVMHFHAAAVLPIQQPVAQQQFQALSLAPQLSMEGIEALKDGHGSPSRTLCFGPGIAPGLPLVQQQLPRWLSVKRERTNLAIWLQGLLWVKNSWLGYHFAVHLPPAWQKPGNDF